MKSFRTFLKEGPTRDDAQLRADVKDAVSSPKAQKLLGTKIRPDEAHYDRFLTDIKNKAFFDKEQVKILGEGSSRIAFQLEVPVHLFDASQTKYLGENDKTTNKAGEPCYKTTIKIAKTPKGIAQNHAEVEIWNECEDKPKQMKSFLGYDARPKQVEVNYTKWLCPIIDTSAEILKTEASDSKGLLFVQMPVCEVDEDDEYGVADEISEFFGIAVDFIEEELSKFTNHPEGFYTKLGALWNNIRVRANFEGRPITPIKLKRCLEFACFIHESGIGDIRASNMGLYKGRPVMIDYAWKRQTQKSPHNDVKTLYTLATEISLHADESGEIGYTLHPK